MQEIRDSIREALARTVRDLFAVDDVDIALESTPRPDLGDLASTVAFGLARAVRRPPREIAARIAEASGSLPLVSRAEVAGGGYLNFHLDRTATLRFLLGLPAGDPPPSGPKRVVEHTNINPNKAAHIGHLRNAVLGDTLVRCLRAQGHPVEVQNYIDDTGVQVADLVVGFRQIEGLDLEGVRAVERRTEAQRRGSAGGFDYHCWDLYARVTAWYAEDVGRERHRAEALHAMEAGEGEPAAIASFVAPRMVRAHLRTMARLGIEYDLLPKESDILHHGFWEGTFERLKDSGAVQLATEGKSAGCWVMPLPTEAGGGEDIEKILVRSNGTVTYTGKDIAYQLWKLGLLGRDFEYRPFPLATRIDGSPLWETATGDDTPGHPDFGGGHVVYNVIDSRQRYPQQVVAHGVRLLGHPEEADRSVHFWYDMVALSPRTAEALVPGLELTEEERARPFLEMAGRRGLGVKADDLLDRLEEKAVAAVRANDPDLPESDARGRARRVAVGALRYYMLRTTKGRVVAFDLDDALSFTGETGPYLQYAAVRVQSIYEKLRAETGMDAAARDAAMAGASFAGLPEDEALAHWEIVSRCARLDETVEAAVRNLELSHVAHYAFDLARAFSSFYQARDDAGRTRFPVVQEGDPERRALRLAIAEIFRRTLARSLSLMGIPLPDRM